MNEISRRGLSPPPPPVIAGPNEIGTTKIACLIGRTESDGTLRVLGFGWHKGRGVRGGSVVDLEEAEKAIRACVGQAEDMADTRLRSVTVNLTCGQPESKLFNVQWPVGGRAVDESDIRAVVREGRLRSAAEGREPIHAMPLHFSVDDTDRVVDPRGLYCTTLTSRLHLIDAASTALRSLGACIARCDLEIEELVSAPMAAGL
ncbi:MAG: cell division protein FtsA, partial [Rhodospirillales bacterium]|nr:cell division protein FtsA [Rhodospirillales bacterium]